MDKQIAEYIDKIKAAGLDSETGCDHENMEWQFPASDGYGGCILREDETPKLFCQDCGFEIDPLKIPEPEPVEVGYVIDEREFDPRYDMHLWK